MVESSLILDWPLGLSHRRFGRPQCPEKDKQRRWVNAKYVCTKAFTHSEIPCAPAWEGKARWHYYSSYSLGHLSTHWGSYKLTLLYESRTSLQPKWADVQAMQNSRRLKMNSTAEIAIPETWNQKDHGGHEWCSGSVRSSSKHGSAMDLG